REPSNVAARRKARSLGQLFTDFVSAAEPTELVWVHRHRRVKGVVVRALADDARRTGGILATSPGPACARIPASISACSTCAPLPATFSAGATCTSLPTTFSAGATASPRPG